MLLKIIGVLSLVCVHCSILSQTVNNRTFEMRYYTDDSSANGPTDFKGETEWMDTDQRIEFLRAYSDYAASYFDDVELNTKLISDKEINDVLRQWKTQPNTRVRETIVLDKWRKTGYHSGLVKDSKNASKSWETSRGIIVNDGYLSINSAKHERLLDTIRWRFKLEFTLFLGKAAQFGLMLKNGDADIMSMLIKEGELTLANQTCVFAK